MRWFPFRCLCDHQSHLPQHVLDRVELHTTFQAAPLFFRASAYTGLMYIVSSASACLLGCKCFRLLTLAQMVPFAYVLASVSACLLLCKCFRLLTPTQMFPFAYVLACVSACLLLCKCFRLLTPPQMFPFAYFPQVLPLAYLCKCFRLPTFLQVFPLAYFREWFRSPTLRNLPNQVIPGGAFAFLHYAH